MARTWLITGSSRGLGRSLAEAVIQSGDNVVATARDTASLGTIGRDSPLSIFRYPLDVTDGLAAVKAVEAGIAHFGHLDLVVNNAGYGNISSIEETDIDDFRSQIEVNLFGTVNVTKAVIKHFRERRSGHFIQISSIGGRVGAVGRGPYSAAKFGVEGFSEVLAQEMMPFGVYVTIVEPGGFRTDFAGSSSAISGGNPAYADTVGTVAAMQRDYDGRQPGDPAKAAQAIIALTRSSDPPLRLILGGDAFRRAEEADERRRLELQSWRAVSTSTDFSEA